MSKLVYIYIRVSTVAQAGQEHVSLECQSKACRDLARLRGFKKFVVIQEVGSARDLAKLTKQATMFANLKDGDTVFCYSYDRISRDMAGAAVLMKQLEKRKIHVVSVTEPLDSLTPAGWHQLMTTFNNAELSSRTLGLKVKQANDHIRNEGGCVGPAPFGQEINPDLPARQVRSSAEEQRVVGLIRALRFGTWTLKQINKVLFQLLPKKRADLRLPIEIFNEDSTPATRPEPLALDYDNIADLMNSYEIYRRGKIWSVGTIRGVCNLDKHVDEEDQLAISMDAMQVDAEPKVKEGKECKKRSRSATPEHPRFARFPEGHPADNRGDYTAMMSQSQDLMRRVMAIQKQTEELMPNRSATSIAQMATPIPTPAPAYPVIESNPVEEADAAMEEDPKPKKAVRRRKTPIEERMQMPSAAPNTPARHLPTSRRRVLRLDNVQA